MITIARIKQAVAEVYGLKPEHLHGKDRTGLVSQARHLAWHLTVELVPTATLRGIGLQYGGRDHSTVRHGIDRARQALATTPALQAKADAATHVLQRLVTEAAP
ncbi:MAG: hypothetical protein LDL44_04510 [Caenispirillum sp.]|nr:hypothetical protein [Caenispirillum sp.]